MSGFANANRRSGDIVNGMRANGGSSVHGGDKERSTAQPYSVDRLGRKVESMARDAAARCTSGLSSAQGPRLVRPFLFRSRYAVVPGS